jgi:nicotinamide mononucleotide adenylyltransferase
MKVGVIVGRFQAPYLTSGHRALIEAAIQASDEVFILLGMSTQRNEKNPLNAVMRMKMINDSYPRVKLTGIIDMDDDDDWSWTLDTVVRAWYPGEDITLFGSRDSFLKVYSGKFKSVIVKEVEGVSATQVRKEIVPVHNVDFRSGVIWAVNQMLK